MSTSKTLKYPTRETVWVRYHDNKGTLRFIMTSKPNRDQYILYELKNNKFVKLGKNASPTELEDKFNINEQLKNIIKGDNKS